MRENEGLKATIAEKDAECERQVDRIIEQEEAIKRLQEALSEEEFQRKRAESLAASRLADQEAIERHTRKVVAGEICDYLCREWPFMGAGAVLDIKEKYEMEVG